MGNGSGKGTAMGIRPVLWCLSISGYPSPPLVQVPLPGETVVFRSMSYFCLFNPPPPPLRKHHYLGKLLFSVPLVVPAQGGRGVILL